MSTRIAPLIKPTASQRRILLALARPGAKAINGPYGLLITDGRGWAATDLRLTEHTLTHLIRVGWVMYTRAPMGRAEYVLTALGREAVLIV